ncbi:uncharacterized protein LOC142771563 [Rhipicephalus microplus]|uniref:uncharacterized protein LOC142771563 n=1 Tax=Rhipicephalus microplus TaxID=6941 RepID=UPI003F6BF567
MPVRGASKDGGRAAASLFNLKGRVSYVKKGYGFIAIDQPERATVYAHRSTIVNPKPGDPRDFGGLKEGDSVIVDVKESPPKFKVRHQAVRVELGDSDAAQRDIPSVSAEYDGPNKAENEILNQVGTVAVVDENGGILTFGAENEARAIFDRQCVPNTLVKATEKVSDIFSVGQKLGFNARLTNNDAGTAQWRATSITTVLRENTSRVIAFDPEQNVQSSAESRPAESASSFHGLANTSLLPDTSITATASAPTGTPSDTGNGASALRAVPPGPQWSAECGAHSTANYAHPVPPRNQALPFPPTPCLEHQGPRQGNAENGASVSVRTRPQQTAEFPTPIPASNHSVHDKAEWHNTNRIVYDTNVSSRTSAPVLMQSSTAATENPAERGRSGRCKAVWAMDMDRSSTKANPAVPAAGHYIPAGTEKPPKTTPFEESSQQGIPLTANSHGCFQNDSTRTAAGPKALRPGYRAPTTAGHCRRPATTVPITTRSHCGASEDEQDLIETIMEKLMPRLKSVIREEVLAQMHELFGHMPSTAGAGDTRFPQLDS